MVDIALGLCIFVGAILYSSVGHAGASAYIAIMTLFGLPPAVIRPVALSLNVVVASLASGRYFKAGLFRWRTLWPFLLGALPMAWVGGAITLPGEYYRPLVGLVLWLSALRLLLGDKGIDKGTWHDPPLVLAVFIGAAIGLLAGLTGTGGGIFLSPLLLFARWSDPRTTSGVAAVFVLTNSLAGLAGNIASLGVLPEQTLWFAGAALAGGLIGTQLGITLPVKALMRLLAAVLTIAGAKLIGIY